MSNIYQTPQADLRSNKRGSGESIITQEMIDGLANGRKWAMFLAVLGYIQFGFVALFALMMVIAFFQIGFVALLGVLIYGIVAYITFKISRFVHLYSAAVSELEERGSEGDLLDSQEFYTYFIKWVGRILVLFLALMCIGFLLALLFA